MRGVRASSCLGTTGAEGFAGAGRSGRQGHQVIVSSVAESDTQTVSSAPGEWGLARMF